MEKYKVSTLKKNNSEMIMKDKVGDIKLQGVRGTFGDIIFSIISVYLVAYTMYIGLFGPPNVMIHRTMHLAIILFLTPLYYPSGIERFFNSAGIFNNINVSLEKYFNIFISLIGSASCIYALINWQRFFTYKLFTLDRKF